MEEIDKMAELYVEKKFNFMMLQLHIIENYINIFPTQPVIVEWNQ